MFVCFSRLNRNSFKSLKKQILQCVKMSSNHIRSENEIHQQFLELCKTGSPDEVEAFFIANKSHINALDTALLQAMQHNNYDVMKKLIRIAKYEGDADILGPSSYMLEEAFETNNLKAVKVLYPRFDNDGDDNDVIRTNFTTFLENPSLIDADVHELATYIHSKRPRVIGAEALALIEKHAYNNNVDRDVNMVYEAKLSRAVEDMTKYTSPFLKVKVKEKEGGKNKRNRNRKSKRRTTTKRKTTKKEKQQKDDKPCCLQKHLHNISRHIFWYFTKNICRVTNFGRSQPQCIFSVLPASMLCNSDMPVFQRPSAIVYPNGV